MHRRGSSGYAHYAKGVCILRKMALRVSRQEIIARNFLLPAGLDGGPGGLSKEIMPDTTPPSPKGHEIWAKAMEPELMKPLGE